MTADTYKAKRDLLCAQAPDQPDPELFGAFVERVCQQPLRPEPECGELWLALWPELGAPERARLVILPDPCLNHLEDRARRPERGRNLSSGASRLARFHSELLLEGIRLFPHALCRASEAIGPLPDSLWEELRETLSGHRLWTLGSIAEEANFWAVAERLLPYRELPQAVIDFLESGRPRESAPLETLRSSFERFLVRSRLESVRFSAYALLTTPKP